MTFFAARDYVLALIVIILLGAVWVNLSITAQRLKDIGLFSR